MTEIESAWGKYPDYEINLVPCGATAKVRYGDLLLAESDACLRVEETKHVDRLYFPEDDVRWELFKESDGFHTICPFKGQASYYSLKDGPENAVWTYEQPYDEMLAIKDLLAFYPDKVSITTEGR